ncbi:GntR family transcriptional regulator [Youxingia wuxianensis]|uniref:GntR family transcriptional regulator n=1 Tax=Youxingia wuxianensis TaxID=2763678 RepID=A0A926IHC8_9FIRM|nr:GntR family transcriptional regulator [Youxingia wuxianensis]MBC8585151.1 GntR family transcriptional regulator [Youxingia wuxianensis]
MTIKKPLYVQFGDKIRAMIQNGDLKYGQSIPSERELSETYSIDRKTIRKGLALLVEEELLVRIPGKGTYVSKPKIAYSMEEMGGYTQLFQEIGMRPSSRVIFTGQVSCGYRLSKVFGIPKDAALYKIVRIRMGDDEPIALETTYLPYHLVEDIEKIDFGIYSLYEIYAENGISPSRIRETVEAVELGAIEAKHLNLPVGEPAFLIIDTTYDNQGAVIEYTQGLTNSKRMMMIKVLQ